jgi:hypothetical protein
MLTIENLEGNNDLYYKYAGSLLFHQFSGIYPDLDQRYIPKNNRCCGANNIESSSFQQKLTAEQGKTGSAKFV